VPASHSLDGWHIEYSGTSRDGADPSNGGAFEWSVKVVLFEKRDPMIRVAIKVVLNLATLLCFTYVALVEGWCKSWQETLDG
jgi:hypothetical protein